MIQQEKEPEDKLLNPQAGVAAFPAPGPNTNQQAQVFPSHHGVVARHRKRGEQLQEPRGPEGRSRQGNKHPRDCPAEKWGYI